MSKFSKPRLGTNKPEKTDGIHPSVLKQARRSGVLNLSQRGLTIVPEEVWSVQEYVPEEAKSVSMDNTEDKWWDVVDLTKLILASNHLTTLGEGLRNFQALTVLDAHDNQLTSLPQAISQLEQLQKLDISRNQLRELPSQIGYLVNLTSLHVEHNHLTELIPNVLRLQKLEFFDVSNNQLTSLHKQISYLCQLRQLNVSHNKLTQLPSEIGDLTALRLFDATHNQLLSLPENLGNLRNLEQLHIRHNQLEYLPTFHSCANLKEILAGNNNIRGLTDELLENLKSLTCLDLRDNKLAKLPDKIVALEKLERIDLTNNDISVLPFQLGAMTSLKAVILDGNPMRSIRRDIIMRGTAELKKYLLSRLKDEENESESLTDAGSNSALPTGDQDPLSHHDLHQMKSLDYSNKKQATLPDEVMKAAAEAGVRAVNLSKNLFTDLPNSLDAIAHTVVELNLGVNKLTQLNPRIGNFSKLQMLDLRSNQLSDLPSELSSLISLRELIISSNRFNKLPTVVFELKKLEILFANDNRIAQLDHTGFLKLDKLGTLDLQNNDLSQIPPEIGNCTWLKSFALTGNPLRNPRPAVLAKGTPALLEYLRSRIVE
ncbi:leucine-rich repeat-containing protein 40 [Biomphalaria pfeifferi]|uniref:Leucine-rich repeat-containing protein 40 n=1 Tax=Biomphalaria pfeifferi TaxID=112525 RepID=A0AAD8B2N4_BIOPF|nr:leucine-rich repeat-containing protein 40 [Biomphalaria pfeifferi]